MSTGNENTANFYPMKTTGTENYGVPAGKPALSMEKGCKNHKKPYVCVLCSNIFEYFNAYFLIHLYHKDFMCVFVNT